MRRVAALSQIRPIKGWAGGGWGVVLWGVGGGGVLVRTTMGWRGGVCLKMLWMVAKCETANHNMKTWLKPLFVGIHGGIIILDYFLPDFVHPK